jgi:predicted membrane channel-forming protein YqfA (hemolysin III family)
VDRGKPVDPWTNYGSHERRDQRRWSLRNEIRNGWMYWPGLVLVFGGLAWAILKGLT